MKECKIINYNEDRRADLKDYLHRTFPSYTKQYIEYCLDNASGTLSSLLVVNDSNLIVGCHLFYCTKALLNGEEINAHWGHDTFLDEGYRSTIGLDFMLRIHSTQCFGLGLSEKNKRIQEKLKTVFFDGVYNCYIVNINLFFSIFQKLFKIAPNLHLGDELIFSGLRFKRVKDAKDMVIPNRGYWFNGQRNLDFIRDSEFLNKRFVFNKVHKYYLYALENENYPCYFVIRHSYYRGIPCLLLCDYRYTNPSFVPTMFDLLKRIAFKSGLGIISFVCGDLLLKDAINNSIHYCTKEHFIAERKIDPNISFCVTGGDSDAEILR